MEKVKLALYKHNWYLANRERMVALSETWAKNNRDKRRKIEARWLAKHKEKRYQYLKEWRKRSRVIINRIRKKSYWNGRREKVLEENNRYFKKARGIKFNFNGFWKACLERDDYTCQKCSAKNNLHVHHLRYGDDIELEDLITWCVSCHMSYHAKQRRKQKWDLRIWIKST